MASSEPKYPVEPLPRLLLPTDYLHNELFFTTTAEVAGSGDAQRKASPRAAAAETSSARSRSARGRSDRSYLCRQLNFSVQNGSDADSSTQGDRNSSRPHASSSRSSPQPRARSSGQGSQQPQSHGPTKTAMLREEYILQRELNRLREEEQRRRAAAQPDPLPPRPRDDIDERVLRPTRAAELRQQYVAHKRFVEQETENNIFFVKGHDTSRGVPSTLLASGEEADDPIVPGRLTKAAQLLREHTLRRLKELEEAKARARAEEEEGLTFKPELCRPVGVSGGGSAHPSSATASVASSQLEVRRTKTEELRRQSIAERMETLEREWAAEQAARDAILLGPGSSRRNLAAQAGGKETKSALKSNATKAAGTCSIPAGQARGEHRELVVTSVNPPAKQATRGALRQRRQASHADPTANAAMGADPRSKSSSRASSIEFYVEVAPQNSAYSPPQNVNGSCATPSPPTGPAVGVASTSELLSRAAVGVPPTPQGTTSSEAATAPAHTPLRPAATSAVTPRQTEATVVDLTPIAPEAPQPLAPSAHTRSNSIPSLSSFSTVTTSAADASQAQADALRRLRETSALSTSTNGSQIRVPVLFTKAYSQRCRTDAQPLPAKQHTGPSAAAVATPPSSSVPSVDEPLSSLTSVSDGCGGALRAPKEPVTGGSVPAAARDNRTVGELLPRPMVTDAERPRRLTRPIAPQHTHGPATPLQRTPAAAAENTTPMASQIQSTSGLLSRTPVDSIIVPDLQESHGRSYVEKSVTLGDCTLFLSKPFPAGPSHSADGQPSGDAHLLVSPAHSTASSGAVSGCAALSEAPPYQQESPPAKAPPAFFISSTSPLKTVVASVERVKTGPLTYEPHQPPHGPDAVTSTVATPPRDVGRRDGIHGTRKQPKDYAPPPSDLRGLKGMQTSTDALGVAVPVASKQAVGAGTAQSPTGDAQKPESVPETPALPGNSSVLPDTESPSHASAAHRTALPRRGAEHGVSLRPRGSPAKRGTAGNVSGERLPVRQQPAGNGDTCTDTVAGDGRAAAAQVAATSPSHGVPPMGASGGRDSIVASRSASRHSHSLTAQSASSHPSSSTERVGAEIEPVGPDSSFVPQYDDAAEGSRRSTLVREDGQPGSHAPTPVRHLEGPSMDGVSQHSPPPRPLRRSRPSSHAHGGGYSDGLIAVLDTEAPAHFVLPEPSSSRAESNSLPQPAARYSVLPQPQPVPGLDQRPPLLRESSSASCSGASSTSSGNSSSSFISVPLRDKIIIELPKIHSEEERINTTSDEPLQSAPVPVLRQSAFSETSSSFRDSLADRDRLMQVIKLRNSLSQSGGAERQGDNEEEDCLPAPAAKRETSPAVLSRYTNADDFAARASRSPSASASTSLRSGNQRREEGNPLKDTAQQANRVGLLDAVVAEQAATSPIHEGLSSRDECPVADQPLDLDERPGAPIPPTSASDHSGSIGRYTGMTAWSARSPSEFNYSGASPHLSDRGGAEDLVHAFGPADVTPQGSPPQKPRYVHADL